MALFYENVDYQGSNLYFAANVNVPSLNGLGFNDRISSIRVLDNTTVVVFEHENYAGAWLTFRGPVNIPNLIQLGFNDVISSIRTRTSDTQVQLTTWPQVYFTGATKTYVFEDVPVVDPNTVRHIIVAPNVVVKFYQQNNFQGQMIIYSGPVTANLPADWLGKVRSLQVRWL